MSPFVKKSAWTAEEDRLLLALFKQHPYKWANIARAIPGRTDDACSKRYQEALDPNLKKDEWTEEEDRKLLDFLARNGGPSKPQWKLIGQELNRSGLGCRNRWRLLERKKNPIIKAAALRRQEGNQTVSHPGGADAETRVFENEANMHSQSTSSVLQMNFDSRFDPLSNSFPAAICEPQPLNPGEDTPFSPDQPPAIDLPIDTYDFFHNQDDDLPPGVDTTLDHTNPTSATPAVEQPAVLDSDADASGTSDDDAQQPADPLDPTLRSVEAHTSVFNNLVPESASAQYDSQQARNPYSVPPVKRRRMDNGVGGVLLLDLGKKTTPRLSSTLVVANE